jgi:hypothetical protein
MSQAVKVPKSDQNLPIVRKRQPPLVPREHPLERPSRSKREEEVSSDEIYAELTLSEHKIALFLNRSIEALRQEKETFNQRKNHGERWFTLRERIGNAAIIFLSVIAIFCMGIILAWQYFPPAVVTGAAGVLFADVVGMVVGVWKTVIKPSSIAQLEPVTTVDQDKYSSDHEER